MDIDMGRLETVSVDPYVVVSDVVSTREAQFHVDIDFCCDLDVCEYYENVPFGHMVRQGFMTKSVRMDIKQLMDPQEWRRMIGRELGEWPLLDDGNRGKLSEFTFKATKEIVRFMPPQHNVLVIPFRVSVNCNRHVDENDPEWMDDPLSDHDDDFETSDSADFHQIMASPPVDEYLKIMKTTTTTTTTACENEDKSCCICLDDFYAGCQVLSMPCSHIFHEDCINKWLQSSHCCPMCRFEMPTS